MWAVSDDFHQLDRRVELFAPGQIKGQSRAKILGFRGALECLFKTLHCAGRWSLTLTLERHEPAECSQSIVGIGSACFAIPASRRLPVRC